MLWEFLDGIYCINLLSRNDRYENARRVFRELRVPNVKFLRVDKHPEGGTKGCFESHVRVAKEALDRGCRNVLIFEDDIRPNKITKERLKEVENFIRQRDDWDLFYLGLCPHFLSVSRKVIGYKNIFRLKNLCAHAYILNRPYMKKISKMEYDGTAVDSVYDQNHNSYGLYPSLFYQENFLGDIQLDGPGRFRRFRERFIQRNKPFILETYEIFFFNREFILLAFLIFIYVLALAYGRR